jgi:hypothetical protein
MSASTVVERLIAEQTTPGSRETTEVFESPSHPIYLRKKIPQRYGLKNLTSWRSSDFV